MAISNLLAIAAVPEFEVKGRPAHRAGIVENESDWRARSPNAADALSKPKVVATRWHALDQRIREVSAETAADSHVVAIVLRNEDVRFSVAGRVVHDGLAVPGMLHVAEPAVPVRCVFRSPYDVIHLHVPNSLIAECGEDLPDRRATALGSGPALGRDSTVERLGRALLTADEIDGSYGQLYADCISTSIVVRLLASARRAAPSERSKVAELARWRLKRVAEYIEASLAEPLSLADLAAVAGLTRMHFAAQFRAATGLPPHEYVLRRRIERAQEMLAAEDATLVDVALSVGFQTQSHFTSVFKRFTGQPPRAWREAQTRTIPMREPQFTWRRCGQARSQAAA